MFKRNLKKTLRSPEAIALAIFVPLVMMVLFGLIFGSVADLGELSYINFIVPGIILQCVANASSSTALGVYNDMSTGIIDRFRSMAISKSAFISGHVWVSVLRSMIITASTIGVAFIIGFRPSASFFDWLIITLILTLFIIAITWIAVVIGLIAKDAESISGGMFLLVVLTFVSSGFAPTDSLPTAIRIFANHQPMTPVIDAVRSLMLGFPLENELYIALAWCVGITIVSFTLAVQIYKSKLTQ